MKKHPLLMVFYFLASFFASVCMANEGKNLSLLTAEPLVNVEIASELLKFENELERKMYYQLIQDLRCPKCQNQNLADSDAPIANDLRNEIYQLVKEGYTSSEVEKYMETRYGQFVRYAPAVSSATAVLWMLPAALIILGLFIILGILKRNRSFANDFGKDFDDGFHDDKNQHTFDRKSAEDVDRRVTELLHSSSEDQQ